MPLKVEKAKIACLDFNLNKFKLGMNIEIQIEDPEKIGKIREQEIQILLQRIQLMVDAGVNVIFTTMAIDDTASKLMVKNNVMGLRRVDSKMLSLIAQSTGAKIVKTFANQEGGETFSKENIGEAESVYEENIGDQDHIFIHKPASKTKKICTIIYRGSNDHMLDEMERSMVDALNALKRTMDDEMVISGGGAVETNCYIHLQ